MLAQRLQRWANIKPTLDHRVVIAGFTDACVDTDGDDPHDVSCSQLKYR